jgi:hypothetical protein
MHIIDSGGKIIEGQALTLEEVAILTELCAAGDGIKKAATDYLRDSTAREIAKYLIENFHLSRRVSDAVPSGNGCREEDDIKDLPRSDMIVEMARTFCPPISVTY